MSQNRKLARHLLVDGATITKAEARSRFGITRLSARINELRADGLCIYTNRTPNGTQYRMGRPSRDIFAAAGTTAPRKYASIASPRTRDAVKKAYKSGGARLFS